MHRTVYSNDRPFSKALGSYPNCLSFGSSAYSCALKKDISVPNNYVFTKLLTTVYRDSLSYINVSF